jgi:lipoate-protein ligase B
MKLMERTAQSVERGEFEGRILFLEHPPTITLGRRASERAIKVKREKLREWGVAVERADRGGEATFHGPGQLVCYPVVNLARLGVGVAKYVELIEEMVIRALDKWGIKDAWRKKGYPGVWTSKGKIAAIGLRVKKRIATHGFAINMDVDKGYFDAIVPCGIEGAGVANVSDFVSPPAMEKAVEELAYLFGEIFGRDMEVTNPFQKL